MCGQVKTQLIDSKIQRHQLQQGTVYLWKAGPQLLVEGKIKAGKECALPQGLLVVVAHGVCTLHGHIGESQRTAGRKLARTFAAGGLCFRPRCRRFLCIQENFLLLSVVEPFTAARYILCLGGLGGEENRFQFCYAVLQ